MNCVLYARVSTDKQAEKELSIPAQLEAMRGYARQRGWIVIEEFLEPGVSARTAERPALKQLLGRCRENPKPDVVLVHKIDRLARNVYDHATIRAVLKQQDIRLASVVENVDESVSGELVENIMASIAQFYSGNLSEEVRKGMRQKVLKGGWPHLPPRGYVLVRKDQDRATRVEPHPTLGSVIGTAFERYATGWFSLKALASLLAREGLTAGNGQALSPSRVHHLLGNPFYAGRVHWGNLKVPGAHEPLVSPALFERVQTMLRRRSKEPRAKGSVRGFPLRGLAICAHCRGHMTAGYHKQRFGYYHCARRSYNKALCPARSYCPSTKAAAGVDRVCQQLVLTGETADMIRKEADSVVRQQRDASERRLTSLQIKRSKLAAKELRLTQAFVAEEISPTAYKAVASALRRDLEGVEAALARTQRKPEELMARIDELLGRASSIQALRDELNEARQIELLRAVFETIVLDETGVIGFTLHPPFNTLFKAGSARRRGTFAVRQTERIGRDLARHVSAEPPPTVSERPPP
jgi:DNA invertase Pin-like site-specific DNA recombinase